MSPAITPVETRHVSVEVGAARLSMHVAGQGRPLVLFHSLLADRSSFDRVLPALAATHTVHALDLPGFDGSDFADGGLEAVADRVAAGLRALNLAQPPTLLGNGYGGFVALLVALRAELATVRVPALVLVGELDEATPPPMSHELAAGLPDAKLVVLPGLAHVPQLQAPEQFLPPVTAFLAA